MTDAELGQLRIGELLGDRYELLDLLGKGGFAAVFRVRNLRLHRIEALKVLSESLTEDPDFGRRFEQEARLAASLDHPNIVKIYDYGSIEDFFWFSMQFIDGPSVGRELKRQGRMNEADAARIAIGVLDALQYSHARGIVHRDIKPDNVLLNREGRPFLTDFGVAKSEAALVKTHAGTLLGSPAYMSPEQLQGRPLDGRSDLYSVGVTLYKMLAGEVPFSGEDTFRQTMRRLSESAPSLSSKRGDVHPALDAIVTRALGREPADRYSSAAEMREAVQNFLEEIAPARGRAGSASLLSEDATPTRAMVPIPTPTGVTAAPRPGATDATRVVPPAPTPEPAATPGTVTVPEKLPRPLSRRRSPRWLVLAAALTVAAAAGVWLWRGGRSLPRDRARQPGTGPPLEATVPSTATSIAADSAPTSPAPSLPTPGLAPSAPPVVSAAPAAQAEPPARREPPPTRAARGSPGGAPLSRAARPTEPPVSASAPEPGRRAKVPPQLEAEAPISLPAEILATHARESIGLSVTVGADGSVKSARVISEVCPECDRAALDAVRRFRFRPARDADGTPVETTIAISIRIPSL